MDRYSARGLKKLYSLTRIKLRLAREAETAESRPAPLPLVKLFSGVEVNTVEDCFAHRERLMSAGSSFAALQLCDIIEGVKYRFEPAENMPLMSSEQFSVLEDGCRNARQPLCILLMAPNEGLYPHSVFIGEDPPAGCPHFSRFVSGTAPLLHRLYASDYFRDGPTLRNVSVSFGCRSLLGNAVYSALRQVIRPDA